MSATTSTSRRPRSTDRSGRARRRRRTLGLWLGALVLMGGLFAAAVAASRDGPGQQIPQTGETSISGQPLPKFDGARADSAVGRAVPVVSGESFAGTPVTFALDGRPKVLLFLAHWCPHCQNEVPEVQAWVRDKGLPEGVALVSVVTATDPTRPNYPPSEWLAREGWTVQTLVDDERSAIAEAYGVSGFPFWVLVDGQGRVAGRAAGERSVAEIERSIESLKAAGR